VHIEIFVRGEGTAGEKLTFCSVRHFKRGDRAIEPIKERLEQLVSEVDVRAMRKTQECGNCKNRCHAVLSLQRKNLIYFCLVQCAMQYLTKVTIKEIEKDLREKRK
jgi:hypothetical protein